MIYVITINQKSYKNLFFDSNLKRNITKPEYNTDENNTAKDNPIKSY